MSDLSLKLVLSADNSKLVPGVRQSAETVRQLDSSFTAASAGATQFGNQTQAGAQQAATSLSNVTPQTQQVTDGLNRLGRAAAGAFLAMKIGQEATRLTRTIEQLQNTETRLQSLSASAAAYAENEEYLIALADEHHKNLQILSNSYTRVLTLEKAGLTTKEQSRSILEGLSNASSALGASNAQLEQTLYGLAQGLSSGTLRAEELNQVTEPLPGLLQELDKAAGMASGGFRQMVNAGEVTSAMFRDILIKALESYDGAAAKTAENLTAKYADVGNAYVALAKDLEEPLTDNLVPLLEAGTATLGFMAENADELIFSLEALALVLGARVVTAITASTAAKVSNVVASRAQAVAETELAVRVERLSKAELVAAQSALNHAKNTTYMGIASTAASKQLAAAQVRVNQASAIHAANLATVTTMSNRATLATRALSGSMALLGGPLGLLITAGSALAVFALNSDTASKKAYDLKGAVDDLSQSYRNFSTDRLESELVDLDAEIAKFETLNQAQKNGLDSYQQSINGGAAIFQSALNEQQAVVKSSNEELQAAVELRKSIVDRINEIKNTVSNTENSSTVKDTSVQTKKDNLAKELAALIESQRSEEQKIAETFTRRQAMLDAALNDNLITEQRYSALSLKVGEDNQNALIALRVKKQAEALSKQRALEVLAAQGFTTIMERESSEHEDRIAQIREQKQTDAISARYQNELLVAEGYYSQAEKNEADHQASLASIKEQQLQENETYWQKWLRAAESSLTDFDTLAASTVNNFSSSMGSAFESMIFDSESLSDAVEGMAESMGRSFVNALGQMAAEWLAYQLVQSLTTKTTAADYAVTLGAQAQSQVAMAGLNAFSSTAAIPVVGPAAAPAASAAAIAAAEPLALAATTAAVAGIAHGGLTNVPEEATYLLQKDERVLSPNQNKDFTNFIKNGGESSGESGSSNVSIQIINQASSDGYTATATETASENGKLVQVIIEKTKKSIAADIKNGGNTISTSLKAAYGLKRGTA